MMTHIPFEPVSVVSMAEGEPTPAVPLEMEDLLRARKLAKKVFGRAWKEPSYEGLWIKDRPMDLQALKAA